MQCKQIKGTLSDYLDGMLSDEMRLSVEAHLNRCAHCRAELNLLVKLVGHIGALPTAKAPSDLFEKIQAQKSYRPGWQSFVKKWFVPFKVKLPLNLAAATLTAALVIFLVNIQQDQHISAPDINFSEQRLPEPELAQEVTASVKITGKRSAPPPAKEGEPARGAGPENRYVPDRRGDAALPSPSPAPEASRVVRENHRSAIRADSPITITLLIKRAPSATEAFSGPRQEYVDSTGIRKRAFSAVLPEAPPTMAEKRDNPAGAANELGQRVLTKGRIEPERMDKRAASGSDTPEKEALNRIRNSVETLGGAVLAVHYEAQLPNPVSVFVEVPKVGYERFVAELKKIGGVPGGVLRSAQITADRISLVILLRHEP